MALKPRFKKVNKNKQFFGRKDFLTNFETRLHNLRDNDLNILFYYGIGGIGKSTLKNNFLNISKQNNFNINIDINLEIDNSIEKFYLKFISDVKKRINLFYFNIAFSIYWSKLHPNQELNLDTLPFIEEGSVIAEGLALVEGLGASTLGINLLSITKKYSKNLKLFFNDNYKKELEELNDMSLLEIEAELPRFLYYDINNHMNNNRNDNLVFFLDTYEYLFEDVKNESKILEIDIWIRDLILSLEKMNTLFCIMGREKIKWHLEDEDWKSIVSFSKLDEFSFEDSIQYLSENNINEPDIRDYIAIHSNGVPFYLNLSIDTYLSLDNPKIEDFDNSNNYSIFERFLRYSKNYEISTFKILSFLKSFDKDLFSIISKDFNTGYPITDFLNFVDYSFVKKLGNDKYSLHDLMKESILNTLEADFKKEVNQYFYEYFYSNIEDTVYLSGYNDVFYFENALYHLSKYSNDNDLISFFENNEKIFDVNENISFLNSFFLYIIKKSSSEQTKDFFKLKFLFYTNSLKQENNYFSLKELDYFFIGNKKLQSEYHFVWFLQYSNKKNSFKHFELLEKKLFIALKYRKEIKDELYNRILLELANLYRQKNNIPLSKKYFDKINVYTLSNKYKISFKLKKAYLFKSEKKLEDGIELLKEIEKDVLEADFIKEKWIFLNLYYALGLFYQECNLFDLSEKYNDKFIQLYFKHFNSFNNNKLSYVYRIKFKNFCALNKEPDINDFIFKSFYILNILEKQHISEDKIEFIQNNLSKLKNTLFQEDTLFYRNFLKSFILKSINQEKLSDLTEETLKDFEDLLSKENNKYFNSDAEIYLDLSYIYEQINLNNYELSIEFAHKAHDIFLYNKNYNKINLSYHRLWYLYNKLGDDKKNNIKMLFENTINDFNIKYKLIYSEEYINKNKELYIEEKKEFLTNIIVFMEEKNIVSEYILFFFSFSYQLSLIYINEKDFDFSLKILLSIKNLLFKHLLENETLKRNIDTIDSLLYDIYKHNNDLENMKLCLLEQIEMRKYNQMDYDRSIKLARGYFFLSEFFHFTDKNFNKRLKYLHKELDVFLEINDSKNIFKRAKKLLELYSNIKYKERYNRTIGFLNTIIRKNKKRY